MPPSVPAHDSWCLTINNFTPVHEAAVRALVDNDKVVCAVFGVETGESGTPHLQGYMRFTTKQRMSAVKKLLGNEVHCETRKGSEQQAWDYCKKDGNVLTEKGEPRRKAYGNKDDQASAVLKMIADGATYPQIRSEHAVFCFWHRRNVFQALSDHRIISLGNDPWRAEYSADGTPQGKFT